MPELSRSLELAEGAFAEFRAAPLSVRKALLCAALVDDLAGRAFAVWQGEPARVFGAEDVLLFRRALREACPALGLLADLCGMRQDAPRLAAKQIAVPASAFPELAVEDYMVSIYNAGTAQRVVLEGAASERLADEVLGEALAWWRERLEWSQAAAAIMPARSAERLNWR